MVSWLIFPSHFFTQVSQLEGGMGRLAQMPRRLAGIVRLLGAAFSALTVEGPGMHDRRPILPGLRLAMDAIASALEIVFQDPGPGGLEIGELRALAECALVLADLVKGLLENRASFIHLVVGVHAEPDEWKDVSAAALAVTQQMGEAKARGLDIPARLQDSLGLVVERLETVGHPVEVAISRAHDSFLIGSAPLSSELERVADFISLRIDEHLGLYTVHTIADRVRHIRALAELARVSLADFIGIAMATTYAAYAGTESDQPGRKLYFLSAFPRVLAAWQDSLGPDKWAEFADAVVTGLETVWLSSEKTPDNVLHIPTFLSGLRDAFLLFGNLSPAHKEELDTLVSSVVHTGNILLQELEASAAPVAVPVPVTEMSNADFAAAIFADTPPAVPPSSTFLAMDIEGGNGSGSSSKGSGSGGRYGGRVARSSGDRTSLLTREERGAPARNAVSLEAFLEDPDGSVVHPFILEDVGVALLELEDPDSAAERVTRVLNAVLVPEFLYDPGRAPAVADLIVSLLDAGSSRDPYTSGGIDPRTSATLAVLESQTSGLCDALVMLGEGHRYMTALARLVLVFSGGSAETEEEMDACRSAEWHAAFGSSLLLLVSFYDVYDLGGYVGLEDLYETSVLHLGSSRNEAVLYWLGGVLVGGQYYNKTLVPGLEEKIEAFCQPLLALLYEQPGSALPEPGRVVGEVAAQFAPWEVLVCGCALVGKVLDAARAREGADELTEGLARRLVPFLQAFPFACLEGMWWLSSQGCIRVSRHEVAMLDVLSLKAPDPLVVACGQRVIDGLTPFRTGASGSDAVVRVLERVSRVSLMPRQRSAPRTAAHEVVGATMNQMNVSNLRALRREVVTANPRVFVGEILDSLLKHESAELRADFHGSESTSSEYVAFLLEAVMGREALPVLLTSLIPGLVPTLTSRRNAIKMAHVTVRYLAYLGVGSLVTDPRVAHSLEVFFLFLAEFLEVMTRAALPPIAFPLTALALIYQHESLIPILRFAPSSRLAMSLRKLDHDVMIPPLFDLEEEEERALLLSIC